MKTILVTGGAGFIGSALIERLHSEGHKTIVLDSLSKQVHGAEPEQTSATFRKIKNISEFHRGDIRDRELVRKLLSASDLVVHLAAETGTGQSMYAISNYCDVNIQGTAILLEEVFAATKKIQKIVVASSRAIYGEGKYSCDVHGYVYPNARSESDLKAGVFQPRCPQCANLLKAVPTTEDSPARPQSIYGITKLAQEELVLKAGHAANIPAIALRFQNVYGPGQSLSNPYTGILSIFSTRARANKGISVFEDGLESRDFVYIDDVVESLMLAIFSKSSLQTAINIGSGESTNVKDVVEKVVGFFKSQSEVKTSGEFRIGDIRHNIADLKLAKSLLGFEAKVPFKVGVVKFLEWVCHQDLGKDEYERSLRELRERGLLK